MKSILTILLMATTAYSQQLQLNFRIVESTTNEGIPNVYVSLSGTAIGSFSNEEGVCQLEVNRADLLTNDQKVTISHLGFVSRSFALPELAKLDEVRLEKSAFQLREWSVISDAPKARDILDAAIKNFKHEYYESEELTLEVVRLQTAFNDTIGFSEGLIKIQLAKVKSVKASKLSPRHRLNTSYANKAYRKFTQGSGNKFKWVINHFLQPHTDFIDDYRKSDLLLSYSGLENLDSVGHYIIYIIPNRKNAAYKTEVKIRRHDLRVMSLEQVTEFVGHQYIMGQNREVEAHEYSFVDFSDGKFPERFEMRRWFYDLNPEDGLPDYKDYISFSKSTTQQSQATFKPMNLNKPLYAQ